MLRPLDVNLIGGPIAGWLPPHFCRTLHRYEAADLAGLPDKRLAQIPQRHAPVDEVMRRVDRYRNRRQGSHAGPP